MLPVDLLGSFPGVSGQGVIDRDTWHLFATQVCDHIVHSFELFLQVVGLPRSTLGILGFFFPRLFADPTKIRTEKTNIIHFY